VTKLLITIIQPILKVLIQKMLWSKSIILSKLIKLNKANLMPLTKLILQSIKDKFLDFWEEMAQEKLLLLTS